MEYINDINIQEAVIHILQKEADNPILNEYSLELNEDTYLYLYNHVNKCIKSDELKIAKFNEGRSLVKEVVENYLTGREKNIIDLSKEVSNQLYAIMRGNDSIPSCDLIVVSIITDQGPMIAILKVDYIKTFTHKVDFINNKIGIGIISEVSGLPVGTQKIQKAAFIKPIVESDEFNLMVLDKQNKSGDEYGENYFTNNFLGCEVIDSERDVTRTLIDATEHFTRLNISENAEKSESVRNTIRNKVKNEEIINIDELAEELFGNDIETKDNFENYLSKSGLTEDVAVDKTWVEKKLKKRKMKIDKEIDITISDDAYNDLSRFEIVKNGDGSINIVIKDVTNYIERK